MKPFQVVRDFEQAICEYTAAPYAVAVNSCTMALLLAVAWHLRPGQPIVWAKEKRVSEIDFKNPKSEIEIPKRTYVSVPQSIIHAGGRPTFRDEDWSGFYELRPLNVIDSARWFTEDLYRAIAMHRHGFMVCVSFHASKTLGIEQGGAILHDNAEADVWLRRARFDGRKEGVHPTEDDFSVVGWHCYMNPSSAAQGLLKLYSLPRDHAPLPNDNYPDLSQIEAFR